MSTDLSPILVVRAPGIEPESRPWQGRVLPLNHARIALVHPEGFEPPTTVPKTGMISISLRVR